jgi:hypothetical protein
MVDDCEAMMRLAFRLAMSRRLLKFSGGSVDILRDVFC